MAPKPSLIQYVGVAAFLTVLAVFVMYGSARGESISWRFLGFVLAFSVIHVSVAYLMIREWVEYSIDRMEAPARSSSTADD
jgi:hypothetical protein